MKRQTALLVAIGSCVILSGCAVYSVSLLPPQQAISKTYQPLDLSVALGDVTAYSVGQQVVLGEKDLKDMERLFAEEVSKLNLVRAVIPKGERADIYFEEITRVNFAGHPSILKALYKGLAVVPALVLPVPFPWDFGVEDTIKLRADVGGVSYTIREYDLRYTMTLWGLSMWAPIFSKSVLQSHITEYIVPAIANKILRDYEFFKRYEEAVKSGDTEAIKKVLIVSP